MHSSRLRFLFVALSLAAASVLSAQNRSNDARRDSKAPDTRAGTTGMVATDPAYKLVNNDSIAVYVIGQNEFSTEQRIDNRGVIRMWQLDEVALAGKTVREAEGFLENLLVERKLLKKPMVQISVREYYPREIYLTGAFNGPGTYTLTRDEASIELKKLVVSRGGLQPKAAGSKVEVTRPDPNGGKTITIPVDVEAMLKGKGPDSFLVYPGDTIYAPLKWF